MVGRCVREGMKACACPHRPCALSRWRCLTMILPLASASCVAFVAYCRNVTNALLDEPRVWGGVERVAKALFRRRYLSPRAVKQLLGDAFFAGVRLDDRPR